MAGSLRPPSASETCTRASAVDTSPSPLFLTTTRGGGVRSGDGGTLSTEHHHSIDKDKLTEPPLSNFPEEHENLIEEGRRDFLHSEVVVQESNEEDVQESSPFLTTDVAACPWRKTDASAPTATGSELVEGWEMMGGPRPPTASSADHHMHPAPLSLIKGSEEDTETFSLTQFSSDSGNSLSERASSSIDERRGMRPRCATAPLARGAATSAAALPADDHHSSPARKRLSSSTALSSTPPAPPSRLGRARLRSGSQVPVTLSTSTRLPPAGYQHHHSSSYHNVPSSLSTSTHSSESGLRASLDAGMAAIRRWIMKKNSPPSSSTTNESSIVPPSPSPQADEIINSSSVTRQHSEAANFSHELAANRSWSGTSRLGEGEDDDDGHDDFFDEPQRAFWHQHELLPPLMNVLEEEDVENLRASSSARQRTQSEPDVNQMRDSSLYHRHILPTSEEGEEVGGLSSPGRQSLQPLRRRRRAMTGEAPLAHGKSWRTSQGSQRQLSTSAAAALSSSLAPGRRSSPRIWPIHGHDEESVPPEQRLVPSTTSPDRLRRHHPLACPDGPGMEGNESSTVGGENSLMRTLADSTIPIGGRNHLNNNTSNSLGNNNVPAEGSLSGSRGGAPQDPDPHRQARLRWIRINRRFQVVITIVALLFSLLLFAILICWVVFTSAYALSFDDSCDVPLKPYYWLVTLQLILDVFRTDIMRWFFNWDSSSNQRIPVRVIIYNMTYLLYAFLVLRLGISSVLTSHDETCSSTAPQLFNSALAFVSLSIAAWGTILFGYLVPFCVVACLLTCNGYNPSSGGHVDGEAGTTHPVFPAAYVLSAAPPHCIEQLPMIAVDESFLVEYPRECCICMEEFRLQESVVATSCNHVFHKACCREWLRQARTCPVCRTDIPSTLQLMPVAAGENNSTNPPERARSNSSGGPRSIPLGPTGRPVVGLIRLLQPSGSFSSSVASTPAQVVADEEQGTMAGSAAPRPSHQSTSFDSLGSLSLDVEEGGIPQASANR